MEKEIKWANGTAVQGSNAQRSYSLATSQKYTIDPTLGGHDWKGHDVYLWVIWATVTVNMNGNISPNDKAAALSSGNWPASLGGGTALGPIDSLANKNLTFDYAEGRYEAKASITPLGVWNVVGGGPYQHSWALDRWANALFYDNGVAFVGNPISRQDTSAASWEYQNPSDTNNGTIYDLDAPGCSGDLGLNVNHSAEVYDNFQEWAVVVLDKPYICSKKYEYYYNAQVDADNKKIDMNTLGVGNPQLPNGPHYAKR